ncbi:glycosyltransferase [Candidatus Uhrbacteria bacterium]|nr:glycosyltransferase [Candidatus Uhrbacteria bacterium]
MKNILFIHSCDIDDPKRGTPIRIQLLLKELKRHPELRIETYNAKGKRIWQRMKELRNYKQSIYLGNTQTDWWTLILSKLFYGKRIAIDLHGAWEEELYQNGIINHFKRQWMKWLYRTTIRLFDLVGCVNTHLQQHLAPTHPNTVVMYPGYDPELFPNPAIKRHQPLRIGYVGNARAYQGTEYVLRVAKRLSEQQLPFQLRIISSEESRMKQLILQELGDHPNYLETRYSVPHKLVLPAIQECDVLLVLRPKNPVTDNSFPSKLPEYLATGRTILITKISDVEEILTHGRNAFLINPDKRFEETVELIEKMIHNELPLLDPTQVTEIAKRKFSIEIVTKAYIHRIHQL